MRTTIALIGPVLSENAAAVILNNILKHNPLAIAPINLHAIKVCVCKSGPQSLAQGEAPQRVQVLQNSKNMSELVVLDHRKCSLALSQIFGCKRELRL